jgi:hypothetical protein
LEPEQLHVSRLLNVEERPFKSLTRKLLGAETPYQRFLARPNNNTEQDGTGNEPDDAFLADLSKFRESILYQFTAFESSIARLQFLRAANDRERERYAKEKLDIEATAEAVRLDTANLRVQLDDAQKTLAIRKTYDVLADKITKNAGLKPRDEQHVSIEKLKAEIEELQRESLELSETWVGRREQMGKVVDEAARLRRQIRNEKEPEEVEAEKRAQEMLAVEDRERELGSHVGTPRPEDDAPTPGGAISRAMTPIPEAEGGTPAADVEMGGQDEDANGEGGATPNVQVTVTDEKGVEDTEMT